MINLTPHVITVRAESGDVNIEPSGIIARVSVSQEVVGKVEGIEIVRSAFGAVENMPEPDGTIYIVSSMVAQALSFRVDIVAPDTGPTAIRDESGRIVAVTRFQRF